MSNPLFHVSPFHSFNHSENLYSASPFGSVVCQHGQPFTFVIQPFRASIYLFRCSVLPPKTTYLSIQVIPIQNIYPNKFSFLPLLAMVCSAPNRLVTAPLRFIVYIIPSSVAPRLKCQQFVLLLLMQQSICCSHIVQTRS